MSQDEKHTAAIIGIASEVAKAVTIWEAFRKLFLDFAEEAMAAAIAFDEAMNKVTEQSYLYEQKLEELSKQIEENCVTLTGTSPKKYGMSLQKHPRKATMHYNYIPRTPRNLPYQRRAY